jgi:hypothetical protein
LEECVFSMSVQNLANYQITWYHISAIRMSDLADVSESLDIPWDKSLVPILKARFLK